MLRVLAVKRSLKIKKAARPRVRQIKKIRESQNTNPPSPRSPYASNSRISTASATDNGASRRQKALSGQCWLHIPEISG